MKLRVNSNPASGYRVFVGGILSLLVSVSNAQAQAPPGTIGYSGYLLQDGVPMEGEVTLHVALYHRENGGDAFWDEEHAGVTVRDGNFMISLGASEPLEPSWFEGDTSLWLEVTVGTDVLDPRVQLESVPYAFLAGMADELRGFNPEAVGWDSLEDLPDGLDDGDDDTLADLGLSCLESGQTPVWDQDVGEWACAWPETNSITDVQVEEGLLEERTEEGVVTLSVDPTFVQRRVGEPCGDGLAIQRIDEDGAVVCIAAGGEGEGDITGITAGDGLDGGGSAGEVRLDANFDEIQSRIAVGCDPGFSIRTVDGAGNVECEEDTDTIGVGDVTAVRTGFGLTGGGESGDLALVANPAELQIRVAGTCAEGSSIREIDEIGRVTCEEDTIGGDVTGVAAGVGLTGGGDAGDVSIDVDGTVIQRRVTDFCPEGQAIRSINEDGTVACSAVAGGTDPFSSLVSCTFWQISLPQDLLDFDEQDFALTIDENGVLTSISVEVDITHADISELTVRLRAPSGASFMLHDGGPGADLSCSYNASCPCADGMACLAALIGAPLAGTWVLTVTDATRGIAASVNRFALVTEFESPDRLDLPAEPSVNGQPLSHRLFGGDGSDGELRVESSTTELEGWHFYNFSSLYVALGASVTVRQAGAPLLMRVQGDAVIEGSITLDGKGLGGGGGGSSPGNNTVGGAGGAGGGALYAEVGGRLIVTATGVLSARGARGSNGGAGGSGSCGYNGDRGNDGSGVTSPVTLPGGGGGRGGDSTVAGGGGGGRSANAMHASPSSFFEFSVANPEAEFPLVIVGTGGGGGGGGGSPFGCCFDAGGGGGGGGGGTVLIIVGGSIRREGLVDVSAGAGGSGGVDSCAGTRRSGDGASGEQGLVVVTRR